MDARKRMQVTTWAIAFLLVPAAVGPLLEPDLDAAWSQEARTVDAQWTHRAFTLESVRDSDNGTDALRVHFDRDRGVLGFALDADAPDDATLHHNLTLQALIEFEDRNRDGRYGLGDPVLQSFPVADMRAGTVQVEPLEGGRLSATSTYRLPDHVQSRFTLEVLMTPTRDTGEGAIMDPTHVRVTLGVEDFPFSAEAPTRLAADLRWDGRMDRIDEGVATEQGPFLFRHRWDPSALVDAASTPVNTTVEGYSAMAGDQTIVAFTYGDPEALQHTMTVGVDRYSSQLEDRILRSIVGEWRLYLLGLVAAGALVGGPLYYLRRRES